MVGFFRRRFGRLPRLLATYPPYLAPHPGDARLLSGEQCEENLAYLLGVRERRLEIAADLLGHFGIDLHAGLTAEDPRSFLAALDRWAREEWPTVYSRSLERTRVTWLTESVPKVGEYLMLSMLMDVAIVRGETVTRRRSDYSWQLDMDTRSRDTTTYRRVALIKEREQSSPVVLDLEFSTIATFEWWGSDDGQDAALHAALGLESGRLAYAPVRALDGAYDLPEHRFSVLPPLPEGPGDIGPRGLVGPYVYDKIDWNTDGVAHAGFDGEQADTQAAVPAAFFYGWLLSRGLLSGDYAQPGGDMFDGYQARRVTALDLYQGVDGCFDERDLTDGGNAFAGGYYRVDGELPSYVKDLTATLAVGLPSVYHVPYTFENQERMDAVIDRRYAQWRAENG